MKNLKNHLRNVIFTKKLVLSDCSILSDICLPQFCRSKKYGLFSRLVPPIFNCFPSFICFTAAQDLSADPVPSLFDAKNTGVRQKVEFMLQI